MSSGTRPSFGSASRRRARSSGCCSSRSGRGCRPRSASGALEVLQSLEPELAHPLGLVLVLGDRLDHLAREALGRLVGVVALGIVEAEALLVVGADVLERVLLGELRVEFLGDCLRCGHLSYRSRASPRRPRRTPRRCAPGRRGCPAQLNTPTLWPSASTKRIEPRGARPLCKRSCFAHGCARSHVIPTPQLGF